MNTLVDKSPVLFMKGNMPSSKNSKIPVTLPGRRYTTLIYSKPVQRYIKEQSDNWKYKRSTFIEMLQGKQKPYRIALQFVRDSKRKFDYINAAQLTQDLMVKHGWLDDDNCDEMIPVFVPYLYDKENPGVYIVVL